MIVSTSCCTYKISCYIRMKCHLTVLIRLFSLLSYITLQQLKILEDFINEKDGTPLPLQLDNIVAFFI